MNKDELIKEMLTAKADKDVCIDLNAYGNGLVDMYDRLVKLFGQSERLVCDECSGFVYERLICACCLKEFNEE